jgi:hypothetical protein
MKRDRFKMSMSIKYVYPNTSELNPKGRGSLNTRRPLAEQTGCSLIEMPADLIKNKTECGLTGLALGSFLDQRAIQLLYESPADPCDFKFVLHTEPSLPRTDGYGLSYQAPLKWYDQDWVDHFIQMIISISEHLKAPAFAIEIHPGDRRNGYGDLIRACKEIQVRYGAALGKAPLILLENRTGQFISTGSHIADFWATLAGKPGSLSDSVGIVLDIQQLFTVTGRDFISQFDMIPLDAIKGLHIHTRHRTPSLQDNIPWDIVFERIRGSDKPLLINPEIHHRNAVPDAIKFCNEMLE